MTEEITEGTEIDDIRALVLCAGIHAGIQISKIRVSPRSVKIESGGKSFSVKRKVILDKSVQDMVTLMGKLK